MVLYPEAQRAAQAEIDKIIGNDRLPKFDDRESLPYIDALQREVMRWHPITPLGKSIGKSDPSFASPIGEGVIDHWNLFYSSRLNNSSTGVPHATTEDDFYKGFFIPKGDEFSLSFSAIRSNVTVLDAVVMSNIW